MLLVNMHGSCKTKHIGNIILQPVVYEWNRIHNFLSTLPQKQEWTEECIYTECDYEQLYTCKIKQGKPFLNYGIVMAVLNM